MFYLRLVQFLFIAIVVITVVTQVFWPLIKGTKLFPYFRTKRTKLLNEIKEVKEEIDVKHLEDELKVLKESTSQTKGDSNG